MLNKKFVLKVLGLLLIDILIQSLFFTGAIITQTNESINVPFNKSIKLSESIDDLETSKNSIYLQTQEKGNQKKIIKYDKNLNKIWTHTNDVNRFDEQIIAANDENLLIGLAEYNNDHTTYSTYQYSFLNEDGFYLNITLKRFPLVKNNHLESIIGFGSGYLFIYKNLGNETSQINGVVLNNDNTTSILFRYDLHNISGEMKAVNPFYLDLDTLEIPLYRIEWNESLYYYTDSYFLEYKINDQTIQLKSTNFVTFKKETEKHMIPQDGIPYKMSSMFSCNLNYLGLDIIVTNHAQLNLWSLEGNLSSYTIPDFFFKFYNSYIYTPASYAFQIKNKCYVNIFLAEEYLYVNTYLKLYEPILLIYSQYSFHSISQYYNYSNLVSKGERIMDITTTHMGDYLVYYGIIKPELDDPYLFIKMSKIEPSFLDLIYQLPLILKLLAGSLLILPILFYFRKKSTRAVPSSETYPLN